MRGGGDRGTVSTKNNRVFFLIIYIWDLYQEKVKALKKNPWGGVLDLTLKLWLLGTQVFSREG